MRDVTRHTFSARRRVRPLPTVGSTPPFMEAAAGPNCGFRPGSQARTSGSNEAAPEVHSVPFADAARGDLY